MRNKEHCDRGRHSICIFELLGVDRVILAHKTLANGGTGDETLTMPLADHNAPLQTTHHKIMRHLKNNLML